MTEIGDDSTSFEASQYFCNQQGYSHANRLSTAEVRAAPPKGPHGGLLRRELTLSLFGTLSSLYCGERAQPSLLSLELRSVPPGPEPLPRL